MGGSLTVSRSFRSWSSSRCRLPARSSAASACSCRLRIFLRTASSELLPAMARRWLRLRSVSALCSCYCCFCCCSYRAQVRRVPPRPARQCRRPLRPRSSPEVTASGPQRAAGGCARAEDGRGWQAGGAPRTPGNRQPVEPLRVRAGTARSGLLRLERGHRRKAFASTPPRGLGGPK